MAHPFPLFEPIWSPSREVLVTPEITSALAAGAAVAIGVSGGKDSAAAALATIDYLKDVGHRGPRVLIHSDLGRVEWRQSLPACHRLATRLGLELIVVRRETGDLVDRWRSRWESNVRRYAELSCVKLILPWSTASMRFCTSELKTSIICRALVRRFPGQTILSATGIRRQESPNRAKAPVAKPQPKLASASWRTKGLDWHPILDWTTQQVFGYLEEKEVQLHELGIMSTVLLRAWNDPKRHSPEGHRKRPVRSLRRALCKQARRRDRREGGAGEEHRCRAERIPESARDCARE